MDEQPLLVIPTNHAPEWLAPHVDPTKIDVPVSICWPKIECGLAAFEDLDCAALLDT